MQTVPLTANQRTLFLTSDTNVMQVIDMSSNFISLEWPEHGIATATTIAPDPVTIQAADLIGELVFCLF